MKSYEQPSLPHPLIDLLLEHNAMDYAILKVKSNIDEKTKSFIREIEQYEKNKDEIHEKIKIISKELINQGQKNTIKQIFQADNREIAFAEKEIISFPLHLANSPDVVRTLVLNGADVNQIGYGYFPEKIHESYDICYNETLNNTTALEAACYKWKWNLSKIQVLISLDDIAPCKMTPTTIQNTILMILNTKSWPTKNFLENVLKETTQNHSIKLNILQLLMDKLNAKQLLPLLDNLNNNNTYAISEIRDFIKAQLAKKLDRNSVSLLTAGYSQVNNLFSCLPKEIISHIANNVIQLDFKFFGKKTDVFVIDMFKKIYPFIKNAAPLLSPGDFLQDNEDKSDQALLNLIEKNQADECVNYAWKLAKAHYLNGFSMFNEQLFKNLLHWSLEHDAVYKKLIENCEQNQDQLDDHFLLTWNFLEDQINELINDNKMREQCIYS